MITYEWIAPICFVEEDAINLHTQFTRPITKIAKSEDERCSETAGMACTHHHHYQNNLSELLIRLSLSLPLSQSVSQSAQSRNFPRCLRHSQIPQKQKNLHAALAGCRGMPVSVQHKERHTAFEWYSCHFSRIPILRLYVRVFSVQMFTNDFFP